MKKKNPDKNYTLPFENRSVSEECDKFLECDDDEMKTTSQDRLLVNKVCLIN